MTEKRRVMAELDAAIDRMDLSAIEQGLDALDALEPRPAAEDPVLFATRIQQLQKEKNMKHSKKKVFAAVAIAAMALCGFTVYAASAFNLFTFTSGDRYSTVRTTDSTMTQQEAAGLTEDNADTSDDGAQPEQALVESFEFDSIEEAQEAMEIPVILPGNMPELSFNGVTAQTAYFGEDYENRTMWISYGDPEEKAMEITLSREIVQEGADVTTVLQTEMDEGSQDTYRSSKGVQFTLFSESDPSGELTANIAIFESGEYSYALVLVGYTAEEQRAMLDTLDLSVYG